ncbi:hypothetical protein BCL76_11773 [Streptomyces sp. CG 926]|nr:hypothetical protein BCL76_11773 [Streptomyces sp. CG 926]
MRGAVLHGHRERFGPGNTPAGAGSRAPGTPPTWTLREHPRGCGEQFPRQKASHSYAGTPPRVRGAAPRTDSSRPGAGNTPAGAGSRITQIRMATARWEHPRGCGEQAPGVETMRAPCWEHPRGCGEQPLMAYSQASHLGTPPRVRGAEGVRRPVHPHRGNTPAGAGSSPWLRPIRPWTREHPRGCGEQITSTYPGRATSGTPPRVRGAAERDGEREPIAGNTPAGAGSSADPRAPTGRRGEHPRGCGEQRGGAVADEIARGTPPRVRGAAPHPSGWGAALREHPRGCGEQDVEIVRYERDEGTPPRVRGAGPCSSSGPTAPGNTPAGAGSSQHLILWRPEAQEHPRGCGEQWFSLSANECDPGTPPRVRGAVRGQINRRRAEGNTPAGAGSRSRWRCLAGPWREHPRGCGEQPQEPR